MRSHNLTHFVTLSLSFLSRSSFLNSGQMRWPRSPFISTPVAHCKLTSQYKHSIPADLESVDPTELQTSNERCKNTGWDPKSNIPWAHVPLCSVRPFRPKHPQNGGRRTVKLLLLYGDDLFCRGRVCVCVPSVNSNSVTLVCSLVLRSSLYTMGGWEGGERAASEHTVLCDTLSVHSMHSSRSHHGTMNILFTQPRAYKHTHMHAVTRRTHSHLEDIQILSCWGIQVINEEPPHNKDK